VQLVAKRKEKPMQMDQRMKIFFDPVIRIRHHRPGHFCGYTIADQDLLRPISGAGYFKNEDYDRVLKQVSEFGYSLEVVGDAL